LKDWVLIVVVNFMWATQVPVIRLIGEEVDSVTVAFLPLVVSTMLVLPVLWFRKKTANSSKKRSWKDLRYFLLPGLIGIFLMQYLYTVGSTKTLASNAAVITLTIPVLIIILASILLKEKLNRVRVVGFVIAIAGVLITSVPDLRSADLANSDFLLGNLIFFFACCCCAYFNTYCKVLIEKGYGELEIFCYSSLVASVASLPMLMWVEPLTWHKVAGWSPRVLFYLLELSVVVYAASMLLFYYVLTRMDLNQVIVGNYLLPFFIALLGVLFLRERITSIAVIGGSLVVLSTLMVTIWEKKLLFIFRKRRSQTNENNKHYSYHHSSS